MADAIACADSSDNDAIIAALAARTFSDHFMAYHPAEFVGEQNHAARGLTLQIPHSDIKPIWPPQFADSTPIFPRPKPA